MAVSFKSAHFPAGVILMGVRWYVVYPLSTRHVEEFMAERGVEVDHSPVNTVSHSIQSAARRSVLPVASDRCGSVDASIRGIFASKVPGSICTVWWINAVDKYGQTIDSLLTEHRNSETALMFLMKAIHRNGLPETITADGSTAIAIRQMKYLNNMMEQDIVA